MVAAETTIPDRLKSILSSEVIHSEARTTGFIQREPRIDVSAYVWSLLLGFSSGEERSLAGLQRNYERASGRSISSSSYQDRFNPKLVCLLRALFKHVVTQSHETSKGLPGLVESFDDLLLIDSTLVRLHDGLAKAYPGSRTNHSPAALKGHLILSVTGEGNTSVKLTSGRTSDGPILRSGAWVKGRLLLLDLGYYRFQLFACIDRECGSFISRGKKTLNAKIQAVHRAPRLDGVELAGKKLQEVLPLLGKETLDVEVELNFSRRAYRGRQSRGMFVCRLVAVWNEQVQTHRLYLTNVPVDRLTAEEVARVYGLRWIIELAFREMKGTYRLDQMPSARKEVVEALTYAALISFFLGRRLLEFMREQAQQLGRRVPEERWAVVFAEVASEILLYMLRPTRTAEELTRDLLRGAIDPNKKIQLLFERAAGAALS